MNIIGWIRQGDKTACGGTVSEGDESCISHGRAYAFQGARVACSKNCVIADGFARSVLSNGRAQVIHGMKTSAGCPLHSTLNDIDGIGNESGKAIAEEYFLNADGTWMPVNDPEPLNAPYDEQAELMAMPIDGLPYFVQTKDGRTFSGRTGADGQLPRIDTFGADEYQVYWGDEALSRMEGVQA